MTRTARIVFVAVHIAASPLAVAGVLVAGFLALAVASAVLDERGR